MSMPHPSLTLAELLTYERLGSYTAASGNDLDSALRLYDWNSAVGGALHEDLGRVEVVLRNSFDAVLRSSGSATRTQVAWFDRAGLFPGRHGQRALDDIASAKRRASRGAAARSHGGVIAELTFGFWRYLCTPAYLTSMWVPTLAAAFANHPMAGSPRLVRADVEDHVQRLHFLRNRVAHHEPIHQRDLGRDLESMTELIGWISADATTWFAANSRTRAVVAARP